MSRGYCVEALIASCELEFACRAICSSVSGRQPQPPTWQLVRLHTVGPSGRTVLTSDPSGKFQLPTNCANAQLISWINAKKANCKIRIVFVGLAWLHVSIAHNWPLAKQQHQKPLETHTHTHTHHARRRRVQSQQREHSHCVLEK
eukprot:2718342-Amphidinium_carterae.1